MNTKQGAEALTLGRITFQDPETDEMVEVALDADVFVPLFHAAKTWGSERAHALLRFGASLVKADLSDLDSRRLQLALTAMQRYVAQWDDPAELALAISYEQLRHERLTSEQAAMFAGTLAGKRISGAAWRKRVDRWAAKQGLPPVETHSQPGLFDEPPA